MTCVVLPECGWHKASAGRLCWPLPASSSVRHLQTSYAYSPLEHMSFHVISPNMHLFLIFSDLVFLRQCHTSNPSQPPVRMCLFQKEIEILTAHGTSLVPSDSSTKFMQDLAHQVSKPLARRKRKDDMSTLKMRCSCGQRSN